MERASSPWRSTDVLAVALLHLVGASLIIVGWVTSLDGVSLARQTGPLDAAMAGVAVSGAAHVLWIVSGRRAVLQNRRRLLAAVQTMAVAEAAPGVRRKGAGSRAERLVAAARMTHYHRPDCVLVTGKNVADETRATHQRANRTPCAVCAP